MALKRKRSESELVTIFPSPARSESSIESFESPISPSPIYPRVHATPSHLSSRTMKRFRDNRPSEEQIHQRTLNMLYSAQQRNQYPADHETNQSESSPVPAARNTQKSLHSFWNIKSAEPKFPASAPSTDQGMLSPMSCDDCGAGLGASDGAADGMDIDDGYSYGVDHFCEINRQSPTLTHKAPLSLTFISHQQTIAEAIGLATSVIAVAEVTGKAIGLTLKIKSLWREVKNVPTVLLEKAEELQDLDDYLKDAEAQTASSPISKSIINDEIMQKSLRRARAALADIQNTIDGLGL
ncbi:hypothetical protein Landi51_13834 [Colletotrichum acutatum]